MSRLTSIQSGLATDRGMRRHHNEDSAIVAEGLGLAVVADGMGGYKSGEVASAITAWRVLEEVRAYRADPELGDSEGDSGYTRGSLVLRSALQKANAEISGKAHTIEACRGMGTTVVAALFYGSQVSIAHVGDSRAYRLRGDALEPMTRDHSLAQELASRGMTLDGQAAPRNLVTRALGIESSVVVDILQETVEPNDVYLLCSDGLNDMVSDEEIGLTLSKFGANLDEGAGALVALANGNGGRDNVSVVLVSVGQAKPSGVAVGGMLKKLKR